MSDSVNNDEAKNRKKLKCRSPFPCKTNKKMDVLSNEIKKPLRPLTAFHIFSQLEKEYMMQRSDRENAAKKSCTSHDADKTAKAYARSTKNHSKQRGDIPKRYRNLHIDIDVLTASPGKRGKRLHRKSTWSRSQVGFLDLSRAIATRWANLSELDIETKLFCQKLAEEKLVEYQEELKDYNTALEKKIASESLDGNDRKISHNGKPCSESRSRKKYEVSKNDATGRKDGISRKHCEQRKPSWSEPIHHVDITGFNNRNKELNHFLKCLNKLDEPKQHSSNMQEIPVVSPCDSGTHDDDRSGQHSSESQFKPGKYGFVDIADDEIMSMWNSLKRKVTKRRCSGMKCQRVFDKL